MCKNNMILILADRSLVILAIAFAVICYRIAWRYEQKLGISHGKGRPKNRTVFLLFLAIFTPLLIWQVTSKCNSSFMFYFACISTPLWLIGWLIWFSLPFSRHPS